MRCIQSHKGMTALFNDELKRSPYVEKECKDGVLKDVVMNIL